MGFFVARPLVSWRCAFAWFLSDRTTTTSLNEACLGVRGSGGQADIFFHDVSTHLQHNSGLKKGGCVLKKPQLLIFQPKSTRFLFEAAFLRLFLAGSAEPNPILVRVLAQPCVFVQCRAYFRHLINNAAPTFCVV